MSKTKQKSRAEIYLIFSASAMMANNFYTQKNFRLDHFLFQFSLERMLKKEAIVGIFSNGKENFVLCISFYCISGYIEVDKKMYS